MKTTVLSLVLGTIFASLSCQSAFAQGPPAFPGVWNQSETGERTVDGVWTWDAARKQAVARWSNGAQATINVVTDDGQTIVMCRFDRTGSAVGMVADYVGIRKGNTISGKVFWRDPLRDKQRAGTWSATFAGPAVDLAGAWKIVPSPKAAFGSAFLERGMFRLERTSADTFMIPGGNSRARIQQLGNELKFFNEAAVMGATAKWDLDPNAGTIQSITWSDGSVWTRIAKVPELPDLTGSWTITPSANTAFGGAFTGPKTFRLERTSPNTFMIPGGNSRARIIFVKNDPHFYNEAAAFGASGKMELDGNGTVQRITWSCGSIWTRNSK